MPVTHAPGTQRRLNAERWRLLRQISGILDKPMTVLAFVWLLLLVLDFTGGLTGITLTAHYVIWGIFGFHFLLELIVAPRKWKYLRRNWLTAIALALPALRVVRVFRVFRVFRAARAVRSVSLVRFLTSLNRGLRATREVLHRRGVGYVAAFTILVTFSAAAAMYSFEKPESLQEQGFLEAANSNSALNSYSESLWWTAMIMTTMGTEYWPKTIEGRVLCFLLALYAFAIFGYITATIASYFIGQETPGSSHQRDNQSLIAAELKALRLDIDSLKRQLGDH